MFKKVVRTGLRLCGYRRSSHFHAVPAAPVELTADEQDMIEYVATQNLSMVSRERLFTTLMACKYVVDQNIDGDFVECGVWRGGNAIIAAEVFKKAGVRKRIWLFDTFAGMTPPTANDVRSRDHTPAQFEYEASQRDTHNEWCYASLNDVKRNFADKGLLVDDVIFVVGDVCQTLSDAERLPATISVLRLDTDWYESTKKELDVLYPRLQIGGCLIIDDYGHWSGARLATDEYFARHGSRPFLQYTDYTGRAAVKVF